MALARSLAEVATTPFTLATQQLCACGRWARSFPGAGAQGNERRRRHLGTRRRTLTFAWSCSSACWNTASLAAYLRLASTRGATCARGGKRELGSRGAHGRTCGVLARPASPGFACLCPSWLERAGGEVEDVRPARVGLSAAAGWRGEGGLNKAPELADVVVRLRGRAPVNGEEQGGAPGRPLGGSRARPPQLAPAARRPPAAAATRPTWF